MKAVDVQFMDLINKDIQFKTPIFQRVYDQREIKALLDNPNIIIHFMGSIVRITEKEQNASRTKEQLLIDGQQRVTTFTLIFLINKRWSDDKEFNENLKFNKLYETSAPIKILLTELEKYDNKEANKDFKSLNIEHVLPQTNGDAEKVSQNWKEMLGENCNPTLTV